MIAEKTGWSKDNILKKHAFAELTLMLADAPRLIKNKKTLTTDDELASFFGTEIE